MLAIRRVLNTCIQSDCDQSELNESNKENSIVREKQFCQNNGLTEHI